MSEQTTHPDDVLLTEAPASAEQAPEEEPQPLSPLAIIRAAEAKVLPKFGQLAPERRALVADEIMLSNRYDDVRRFVLEGMDAVERADRSKRRNQADQALAQIAVNGAIASDELIQSSLGFPVKVQGEDEIPMWRATRRKLLYARDAVRAGRRGIDRTERYYDRMVSALPEDAPDAEIIDLIRSGKVSLETIIALRKAGNG